MQYTKTIVCLANSRKMSGRCVAGKEVVENGYGAWIRPVSRRPTEEISEEDRRYENGDDPQILDVIEIPCLSSCPRDFQSENHLIDDSHYWKKVGRVELGNLEAALDAVKGPLWLNGYSSYNGVNDRVPIEQAQKLTNSLVLIGPVNLKLIVAVEGAAYRKRRVRVRFRFDGDLYSLPVTDPHVESDYLKKDDGEYEVGGVFLCISLGEPYEGYAYKLVAGLIAPGLT